MGDLSAFLSRLDPDPRVRGRQFELICRWFLQNDPRYASQLQHVWLWHEWPGRWGPDTGIDLVAETFAGELWAIQAKCVAPEREITKREVDSFLAESARSVFTFRLLIATTDGLGPNARRTMEGQATDVAYLLRSDLESSAIPWPGSFDDLRPAQPIQQELRPHQAWAVEAVCRGFESADRGRLIMACGTGKTLVGLHVAKRLGSRRTLVLVPSLLLVSQTLREWTANAGSPSFDHLLVCSDTNAGRTEDSFVPTTAELGLPVTLDAKRISSFLSDTDGWHVVFSTYQSSPLLAEAASLGALPFDLAICDEAHRCAGPEAGPFAAILDEQKVRATRRLFMTATPRYFSGRVRREAAAAEYEVASMDDEARFGPEFHRLSFGQAITEGLLSDYRVVVIGTSNAQAHSLAERGAFIRRDGERTDARTLGVQVALAKPINRYDLRRVVSFHSRVALARSFAGGIGDVVAWLPDQDRPDGRFDADHVSGQMDLRERNRRLKALREVGPDERMLLANARCLQEGVDVPKLDGIAFIDPRRSQVDIVQAVGRAIRKSEGKVGTVVVPVFIGEGGDPAAALDSSAFKPVWDVLRALRAHDEVLAGQLDSLRRGLGERGVLGALPSKIVVDIPGFDADQEFAKAFDARLVLESTANWEFWFGRLERYAEREGAPRPAIDQMEERLPLGQWAATQRQLRRTGRLLTDRENKLDHLPGWQWDLLDADWEQAFALLRSLLTSMDTAAFHIGTKETAFDWGSGGGVNGSSWRAGNSTQNGQPDLRRFQAGHGTPRKRAGPLLTAVSKCSSSAKAMHWFQPSTGKGTSP